jgi:hypothetical protein
MPNTRIPSVSFGHQYGRDAFTRDSSGDNPISRTSAYLPAGRKTQMTIDLRNEVGRENMYTFAEAGMGIRSRPRLIADRVTDPYVNYLKNTGQLADTNTVAILRRMVSRLGKPALAQQLGNPQQYVSHGFDHSERVAEYMDKIANAHPEIESAAASKYNISPHLARFLFHVLAHWHDVGYPDLDSRPKSTHGLTSASLFSDNLVDQLGPLIRRENGRSDQALQDMRKAIQLHSADVSVEHYPINVKTDRGSLLTQNVNALRALLDHYSTSSRRSHRISAIEVQGHDAGTIEKQITDMLKTRSGSQSIKVTAREDRPEYAGRPASLDKRNQVKVGLRYTEQELTENPFAIIRLADNLDMTAGRLSPLQRTTAFRTMYWKLGDQGPIARTLSALNGLDGKNTSDVPDILRGLRQAASGGASTDVDSSILSGVAGRLAPNAIRDLDASAARRLLIRSTVDSVLDSPVAQSLSEPERSSLREVGYRLNGESILHFGGCEAIETVDVKPEKIVVTVNEPLYRRLNEVKSPDGTGIGEYQIERARQALSSLTINGERPVIEVVGRTARGA